MTHLRVRTMLAAASVLALAVAACGDDAEQASSSDASTTIPPATVAPATTAVDTTVPATTVATTSAPTTTSSTTPSTTAPPLTTPPQTSPPAGEQWSAVEFTPSVFAVGYSGNYEGVASPPAPADADAPLADGYYSARLLEPWTSADPGQLRIEVGGFAPCSDIGDACYENLDDPNELGVDPSWSRTIDVPLDQSTDAIVRGFRCFDTDEIKHGSGAALGELFAAYDRDYAAVIAPMVASGMDGIEIMNAVAAQPAGGFVADAEVCGGGEAGGFAGLLRYTHADAPMLLLQTVTTSDGDGPSRPLGATDLIGLQGVDVRGGVMTWYFYAGFYS